MRRRGRGREGEGEGEGEERERRRGRGEGEKEGERERSRGPWLTHKVRAQSEAPQLSHTVLSRLGLLLTSTAGLWGGESEGGCEGKREKVRGGGE